MNHGHDLAEWQRREEQAQHERQLGWLDGIASRIGSGDQSDEPTSGGVAAFCLTATAVLAWVVGWTLAGMFLGGYIQ